MEVDSMLERELMGTRDMREVLSVMRPPRIAIGVSSMQEIAEWTGLLGRVTATWGGLASTIYFPSDRWQPGSLWDRLLTYFDPDYLVFSDRVDEQAFRRRYNPLGVSIIPEICDSSRGMIEIPTATPTSAVCAAQIWSNFGRPGQAGGPSHLQRMRLLGDEPHLALLLARTYGYLSPGQAQAFRDRVPRGSLVLGEVPIEAVNLLDFLSDSLAQAASTPAFWNGYGLTSLEIGNKPPPRPILVLGTDTDDICLWLTLAALRTHPQLGINGVFWMPLVSLGDLVALRDEEISRWGEFVVTALIRSGLSANGSLSVVSTSLSPDHRLEYLANLAQTHNGFPDYGTEDDVLSFFPVHEFPIVVGSDAPSREEFDHGEALRSTPTIVPEWIRAAEARTFTLLAEFEIERYQGPASPVASPAIHSFSNVTARNGRYGIVADIMNPTDQQHIPVGDRVVPVRLQIHSADALAERYAAQFGGTTVLTINGQQTRDTVRRLGGMIPASEALRSGPLRHLLDHFLNPEPAMTGKMRIEADDRIYIREGAMERILQPQLAQIPMDDLIHDWTERSILHFGIVLGCPHCRLRRFYRWGEMNEDLARCPRCNGLFAVSPQRACGWEPTAGLNEIVYQTIKRDAIEEIALATWLSSTSETPSIGLSLTWENVNGMTIETDVVGTIDGDWCIGEAKSSDHLEKPKSGKEPQEHALARLAQLTDARRLVFATSKSGWKKETRTRLNIIQRDFPGVRIEAYSHLLDGPMRVDLG